MTYIKSVMNHAFSVIPDVQVPRSKFNRSHGYKTTFDASYLVPVFCDIAVPGDTFNVKMTALARVATLEKPIMDNLFLDSFFFAVPIRLIWDNFKKFMGEQNNPGDSTSFIVPYMDSPAVTGHIVGSLSDYFGIPTGVPGLRHSSLWHRSYNLCVKEWFRDENFINSPVVDKDDGPDTPSDYVLRRRGKRHDYFTSCLPWPQKGTAVTLPLGSTAPVLGSSAVTPTFHNTNDVTVRNLQVNVGAANTLVSSTNVAATGLLRWDNTGMYTDLTNATASTINSLRQAFQLQRMMERDARGGTRYHELVRSHFGVQSLDLRATRPEYLGGGSTPIMINPVVQNSVSGATPQGNLSATGTVHAVHGFTKSFTEHCIIIGIVNVRADLTYQQGLDRMFSYSTKYDFYWPSLAHLGEQAVLNKEIYAVGSANPTQDAAVFGYQERYAEMRYKPSRITGQFRSTYATPLDNWHLSQEFGALPTLGQTFIEEDVPMDRVVAVDSEPDMIFDSYFDMICARPMPTYSVPGLIDHF